MGVELRVPDQQTGWSALPTTKPDATRVLFHMDVMDRFPIKLTVAIPLPLQVDHNIAPLHQGGGYPILGIEVGFA